MRVLIVTSWYPTATAPVSGVFVRRDAELLATTHDVEVIHLAPPASLSAADTALDAAASVPVTRIPVRPLHPVDLRRAWRPLRERMAAVDILHTQAFASLLPFAGRRVTLPWVHSEHWSGIGDPSSLTPRGRAILRVAGGLLRRPAVVTTVSSHLAQRVRSFRRGPIRIVPPAVAPVELRDPPGDPMLVRLVAVGGLVPGKDPLLAWSAAQELRSRGVDAELTWVGDGPLRAELAASARVDDRLHLPGALDGDGVARALDAADVFVLPTRGETLCLAAIEAITHGRPVVIGDRGGQREYIVEGNGRLVGERTAQAYADAVLEVRARHLAPRAVAATIGDRFHPARVLTEYDAAYADALAG